MKAASEFVENLHEVFVLFGDIEAKRMFGGYGVFHDGLMFALVADDVLYLKSDGDSESSFRELGLERFVYEKEGTKIRMSCWSAPDEIFDDPEQAKVWADRAYGAALRAKRSRRKPGLRKN